MKVKVFQKGKQIKVKTPRTNSQKGLVTRKISFEISNLWQSRFKYC